MESVDWRNEAEMAVRNLYKEIMGMSFNLAAKYGFCRIFLDREFCSDRLEKNVGKRIFDGHMDYFLYIRLSDKKECDYPYLAREIGRLGMLVNISKLVFNKGTAPDYVSYVIYYKHFITLCSDLKCVSDENIINDLSYLIRKFYIPFSRAVLNGQDFGEFEKHDTQTVLERLCKLDIYKGGCAAVTEVIEPENQDMVESPLVKTVRLFYDHMAEFYTDSAINFGFAAKLVNRLHIMSPQKSDSEYLVSLFTKGIIDDYKVAFYDNFMTAQCLDNISMLIRVGNDSGLTQNYCWAFNQYFHFISENRPDFMEKFSALIEKFYIPFYVELLRDERTTQEIKEWNKKLLSDLQENGVCLGIDVNTGLKNVQNEKPDELSAPPVEHESMDLDEGL